jgi:hypothetical protein
MPPASRLSHARAHEREPPAQAHSLRFESRAKRLPAFVRLGLAVLCLLVALVTCPRRARACSCPTLEPAEAVDWADAVFLGRVLEASIHRVVHPLAKYMRSSEDGVPTRDVWILRLAVEKAWKGAVHQDAWLMVNVEESACGFDEAHVGDRRLVFAWNHGGAYGYSTCPARLVSEHDVEKLLGPGKRPGWPGPGPRFRDDATGLAPPPFGRRVPHVDPSNRGCACSVLAPLATPGLAGPARSAGPGALALALVLAFAVRMVRRGGARSD